MEPHKCTFQRDDEAAGAQGDGQHAVCIPHSYGAHNKVNISWASATACSNKECLALATWNQPYVQLAILFDYGWPNRWRDAAANGQLFGNKGLTTLTETIWKLWLFTYNTMIAAGIWFQINCNFNRLALCVRTFPVDWLAAIIELKWNIGYEHLFKSFTIEWNCHHRTPFIQDSNLLTVDNLSARPTPPQRRCIKFTNFKQWLLCVLRHKTRLWI